jgi:hypothetical protein
MRGPSAHARTVGEAKVGFVDRQRMRNARAGADGHRKPSNEV